MSTGSTAMQISDEATAREAAPTPPDKPAAILRGSARGLEIVVDALAGLDAISGAISARLAEAPGFFKGSDVRVRVQDGPLPTGSLARLEELATTFDLRLVEIGAAKPASARAIKSTEDGVPQPNLAAGSAPAPRRAKSATDSFETAPTTESVAYRPGATEIDDEPTLMVASAPNPVALATAMALAPAFGSANLEAAFASARAGLSWVSPPAGEPTIQPSLPLAELSAPAVVKQDPPAAPIATPVADQLELALLAKREEKTRIVIGPVRSGVILDHRGHVIVFGDVNPGAEVRAEGNIIVLGRLRGLAHAGIGADAGFIVALHLQPQQLRIGRMVARAPGDRASSRANIGDTPAIPEIAYVNNGSIVVERYQGKLPAGLADSLK
jgi:septum formation inhibitor MinC